MGEKDKEWFEEWFGSPFYQVLYKHRTDEEAKQFVNRLAEILDFQKDEKALDVGCGDGRYAAELSTKGLCVTGIDIAFKQIEKAKLMESHCTEFFLHDMREAFRYNYYNYVFNFFTSFGYFDRKRDTLAAANTLAAALIPEGKLIIDYLNVEPSIKKLNSHEKQELQGISFEIHRKVENGRFIKDIKVTTVENEQYNYQEQVAAFRLKDFLGFFEGLGMKLLSTYGSYSLEEYEECCSPRLIMVFEKK